jgi:hypothetical protein
VHQRPPAFGGSDGQAYTVATLVDETTGEGSSNRFGAALLFVRWSEAGERAVGHLESEYLGLAPTADQAMELLRALPLRQVQEHLEACIQAAVVRGEASRP